MRRREADRAERASCDPEWRDPLFQPLRLELHRRGQVVLVVQPATEGVHRTEPRVAGDGLHAPLAKMDDEALKIRFADQRTAVVAVRRGLLCGRERFPRGSIPLKRRGGDVVDVGPLAKELLKELFETRHGARRSFPT